MKVAIWQETKYKTNAAVGSVAILIQRLKPLVFSSLYRKGWDEVYKINIVKNYKLWQYKVIV
ncbi:MAG: hypothetical protein LBJ36_03685 [Synergistaceae bacterium]|jgi:hypothetical protein|nr:hypothetical protein [Synergistaceae bacterium]